MKAGTILRSRYRILDKLGSGGFGETYLAEDGDLPGNPRCVVKHLQPKTNDPGVMTVAKQLFEREAETLYKLGQESDRIPSLFAHFEERGQFYLVLEYIEDKKLTAGKQWGESANRRQLLQWLAFGSAGFAGAAIAKALDFSKPAQAASPSGARRTQTFTTVKVNSQGQIIERLPGEATVFAENLGGGISLEMVSIPGGRFLMGSPENEKERSDHEGPQRWVEVSPFFLGKYPVTQAQYEAVMGNNPSRFSGVNRPVEVVNWNDATEFCQKLSQQTGKTYRLPSEAEWEYACRAGTTTPFYFGETITTELANYDGNYTYASEPKGVYLEETTDVGSFPPNAFGLYDMHGLVWEWCQDVWHYNYNGAPTDGSAWVSGGDSRRVVRGGSWNNNPRHCRCAYRLRDGAAYRYVNWGFRVVLVPGV